MNIAQFFVNLGIKGGDDTNKKLKLVDVSLRDLGSNALWAKAGILGAMWGLERMMSGQNAAGAGMVNFAASTGLSMQKLQEWKWAAQQVNVAGGDVESSLKGVQNTMMALLQGKGRPEGLSAYASYMKQIGKEFKAEDVDFTVNGTEKMNAFLKNMQGFVQSGPIALTKDKAMSFGLTESMVTAMNQNAFTDKAMAGAPKYSDGQAKALSSMQAQWANAGTKIENGMGKIFAKHGPQMVKDINEIIPKILKLTEALINMADRVKIFKAIGMSFEGWSMILDLINDGVKNLTPDEKDKVDNKGFSLDPEVWMERYSKMKENFQHPGAKAPPKVAGPKTTTVHQTNNFNGVGNDPKKIAGHVGKAVKSVVQTSHARTQKD